MSAKLASKVFHAFAELFISPSIEPRPDDTVLVIAEIACPAKFAPNMDLNMELAF